MHTSSSASASKNSSSKRPKLGTKRDVVIGISYVLLLLGALGYGGMRLCQWKSDLDSAPALNCYDPVWSNQGDSLAFLQTQPTMLSQEATKCSLWTVDQRADSAQNLVKDLEDSYHIIGWLDNDDTIVMRSNEQDKLTLMVISLSGHKLNRYSFNDSTISYVGKSNTELYLQRQLHNAKTNSDEIELLTWSPTNPTLTKITAIPNRPSVEVSIESVVPNVDARLLSIVLRSVPKNLQSNTKAAPPALPQGADAKLQGVASDKSSSLDKTSSSAQYSVWVLNRFAKRLTFTNFSSIEPEALRLAWSNDSNWLACVASFEGYSDLALYEAGKELRTVRLRTYAQEGALTPQMRSSKPEVHLISNERVLLYDFSSNSSNVWADSSKFKHKPTSITLAKSTDALALTTLMSNSTQLYVGTLSNISPQHVDLDGKSVPPTIFYDIATALQCASKSWFK